MISWKDVPDEGSGAFGVVSAINRHEAYITIAAHLAEHGVGVTMEELVVRASPHIQAIVRPHRLPCRGEAVGLEACETAAGRLALLRDAMARYFDEDGLAVLACPATRALTPRIGEEAEADTQEQQVPMRLMTARHVFRSSAAGLLSRVLHGAVSPGGLPIGIAFDGPLGQDRQRLALGLALDKVKRHRPMPRSQGPRRASLYRTTAAPARPAAVQVCRSSRYGGRWAGF